MCVDMCVDMGIDMCVDMHTSTDSEDNFFLHFNFVHVACALF
jgi:hypothetical protein